MSRTLPVVLVVLLAPGCVESARPFTRSYSADDAHLLLGTVERGSVSYSGTGDLALSVDGESIGRGSSKNKACKRRKGNSWSVDYAQGVLHLEASSDYKLADVDFDVRGPDRLDTDILVERGDVALEDVEGTHLVTASTLYARGLVGDVDLLARSGGFDVEVFPYSDGYVYLESSSGSSVLALPYGGAYDIQVFFDPDYVADFAELGWDDAWLEPGYFEARTGNGAITVVVAVDDGTFQLVEAL